MYSRTVFIKFFKKNELLTLTGEIFGDYYQPRIVNKFGVDLGETTQRNAEEKLYDYLKERGYNVSYTNDCAWIIYTRLMVKVRGKAAKAQFAVLNSGVIELTYDHEDPKPREVLPIFTSI